MMTNPNCLTDLTNGKLELARAFADKIGKRANLEDNLQYLDRLARDGRTVKLFSDFAPQSFYFVIETQEGHQWMNGGVIFHGDHDGYGSGEAPTFSCCLEPTDGWQIHT